MPPPWSCTKRGGSCNLLRLERPAHQFLHRIFRRDAFIHDAVDLLANRHFNARALRNFTHGPSGEDAFDDWANRFLCGFDFLT